MGPPSINIEYMLSVLYGLVTGASGQVDLTIVPGIFMWALQGLAVIGIVFSVMMLLMTLYYRSLTLQVEHHGFYDLELAMRAYTTKEPQDAKNPRWEGVKILASSPNDSDWRRAIIEADIMLDQYLTDRGYPGETLGEKLKNANPLQFTTLDLAWEAHRMRNAIAHLGEAFPLTERDIRATVDLYQRVFEEFDYI